MPFRPSIRAASMRFWDVTNTGCRGDGDRLFVSCNLSRRTGTRQLFGVDRRFRGARNLRRQRLEAAMVLESRRGDAMGRELDLFIIRQQLEIVPFDADHIAIARQAFRRFGKGQHPAALNFGDCFAYALAKLRGEPLLAKGNDFRKTDIPMC